MKYKINVTQEDIDKGLPIEPCLCPVALSICRELGLTFRDNFGVTAGYIRFGDKEIHNPKKVSNFIIDFDSRREVKPFSFILDKD